MVQLELLDLMISTCCQPSAHHPFGHRILEELTFLILAYLPFAGLPKVDDRLASQMLRFDFWIVQEPCHFLFSPLRETPLL